MTKKDAAGLDLAWEIKGLKPAQVLERGLSRYLDRSVRLVQLHGQPLPERSTHAIYRLHVTLATGEQYSVIFKQLSCKPNIFLPGGRCEVLMYRQLLAGQRFGAPTLYASVCDEARDCAWLFLEDVGEWTLHKGGWQDWLAAARLLAQVHGTHWGMEQELRDWGFLAECNGKYYFDLITGALKEVTGSGYKGARARFRGMTGRFNTLVAYLLCQPRTLVHGDVFPNNFIVQEGSRIRLIDWTDAALGLAEWDLVRLLDGWGTDKPILTGVYLTELERHLSAPLDRAAFHRTLLHCEVLNVLMHMVWERERCWDEADLNTLLDQLADAWLRVDKEGGDV